MTTTPNQPDREREAARIVLNSYHFYGEPAQFNAAITAMLAFRDADRAGEGEIVMVPRETLREWYTGAFAAWVKAIGGEDDDGPTPAYMREMEAALQSTPATPLVDDETVERN